MAQEQDHQELDYPLESTAYKILDEIGFSRTADVYKATCIPFNSTVAIKSINLDQFLADSVTVRFDAKATSSSTLLSGGLPNILEPHCVFLAGRRLWVVMPFMSAGSLKSIISSSAFPDGLPEPIIAEILKETLNAVSFLHNQGHQRRKAEIKTGNILLDSNGHVKLADFGVYKPVTSKDGSFSSSDIWSFGITAMELSLGRSPLFRSSGFEKHEKSKNKKFFSEDFKEMVASCLNQDPSKRSSAGDLLNHSFFKNCKGADFIVKNLLQGLPTIEERFKQSTACDVDDDYDDCDDDDGLRICGWNFNEDEFELDPIFKTEPQVQDDDTVVKQVRVEGETIIPDQKLELGGSGLNSLGRVGDEAQVGADGGGGGDLVVEANHSRERMLDGMIQLRMSLDEQMMNVRNLINVLGGGEVTEDEDLMLVNEHLRLELKNEMHKNYQLELELESLKLVTSGGSNDAGAGAGTD